MFTTSKKASHKKKYTHTHAQTTEWFTHCGQMPLDCKVVNQSVVRARPQHIKVPFTHEFESQFMRIPIRSKSNCERVNF